LLQIYGTSGKLTMISMVSFCMASSIPKYRESFAVGWSRMEEDNTIKGVNCREFKLLRGLLDYHR